MGISVRFLVLPFLVCGMLVARPVPPRTRIVVGVKPGMDVVADQLMNGKGKAFKIKEIRMIVLEVSENAIDGIRNSLKKRSDVFSYVEDDVYGSTEATPTDPLIVQQSWTVKSVFKTPPGTPGAWDLSKGGAIVGEIDSGIDGRHPDLAGKVLGGWDLLTRSMVMAGANSDTGCETGHGTAVAGTIAALTNNMVGIAGGAWLSPIIPLVVTNSGCYAWWSDIAAAAVYAVNAGAKVINISIWGPTDSSGLESGLAYAYGHNVPIIAAAGNNGNTVPGYPAHSPYVTASVGAVNPSDVRCPFSNYGAAATIFALGCNVYTTQRGGTYGWWYGTSFATPIVTAAVALLKTLKPNATIAQIKVFLGNNSDNTQAGPRLNAWKLLVAAQALP